MAEFTNNSKLKLLICIDFIYTDTAGTENQLIKLINNLDHNKYEIYLLCLKNTLWLENNKSMLNCSVTAFNYNEHNHKDTRNLLVMWKTIKHMKTVKPDIVISFFKVSYILGVIAARLAGIKYIISTRRDYGLWIDAKGIYLLKFANRFVHSIITNSYKVKELTCLVEKYDSDKVHVIYNGLDFNEFENESNTIVADKIAYGIPANNKVVGILAGLRPMKHHDCFFKAAKRVLYLRQDVSFVIIGDGILRPYLENYTKELGIEENTHFLGWQNNISRFLSFFDIGVNCSSNEGLSNAIMEYMAKGVPCIVSDAGGNTELISNNVNGFVFPLDDDYTLANLIVTLLNERNKCCEFALKSRLKIKSNMTVEKMITEYERYLTSLLS
jgi:glycosyltransferase involved in cell wall biosynthesis